MRQITTTKCFLVVLDLCADKKGTKYLKFPVEKNAIIFPTDVKYEVGDLLIIYGSIDQNFNNEGTYNILLPCIDEFLSKLTFWR